MTAMLILSIAIGFTALLAWCIESFLATTSQEPDDDRDEHESLTD